MHISKAKLPFYPPYEVKYRLQNGVSTTVTLTLLLQSKTLTSSSISDLNLLLTLHLQSKTLTLPSISNLNLCLTLQLSSLCLCSFSTARVLVLGRGQGIGPSLGPRLKSAAVNQSVLQSHVLGCFMKRGLKKGAIGQMGLQPRFIALWLRLKTRPQNHFFVVYGSIKCENSAH